MNFGLKPALHEKPDLRKNKVCEKLIKEQSNFSLDFKLTYRTIKGGFTQTHFILS